MEFIVLLIVVGYVLDKLFLTDEQRKKNQRWHEYTIEHPDSLDVLR